MSSSTRDGGVMERNKEGARQVVEGEAASVEAAASVDDGGQIEMLNRKIIELQERVKERDRQKAELCEEVRRISKQYVIMLDALRTITDLYEESSRACHKMMDLAREDVNPHIEAEREACAKIADDLEAMEARLAGLADNGQDKALLEERADASRVIAGKIRARGK
jgi:hypothetical protein